MGHFREVDLGSSFPPFGVFREHFGFVPNLFRAQTLLPRLIEAEAAIASAVLFSERSLSRAQKERILLSLAAAHGNLYCVSAHYQALRLLGISEEDLDRMLADYRQAGLTAIDTALLASALKLGRNPISIEREDVTGPFVLGLTDESMLEAVQVVALTNFLCTLSTGLGVAPDFQSRAISTADPIQAPAAPKPVRSDAVKPYLRTCDRSPDEFAPFAFFRETFGFIPNIFKAQTLRPDVVTAETEAIRTILLTEDVLTRLQKELILLVVSAANLNTYCVAVHCEILRTLGVSEEDSDQIAVDHRQARLQGADKALLDFALKLAIQPAEFGLKDLEQLRGQAFTEEQILEAIVMTAFTNFLNTLQMGLGVVPDFVPRRSFEPAEFKTLHLLPAEDRPIVHASEGDPDAECVARVLHGDVEAFQEIIERHGRRVYRTLVGVLGDSDEARDAMQDTLLKAFQHLGEFQGRSKFSTWLVSIASNTGLQRLRERRNLKSLDEGYEDEDFRPRQVRAWADDPEQMYARAELRALVEISVKRLPAKYRVVVVLRDMEHLSTEEAATALGLGIPALKARLLRGRLMLREALSQHFTAGAVGSGN